MKTVNMIDLNDDDSLKQDVVVEGNGSDAVTGPTDIVKVQSGLKKEDVYDRFQKIVYLFDVSGSMQEGMSPGEIDQVAIWSDEIILNLRVALRNKALNAPYFNFEDAKYHFKDKVKELESDLAVQLEAIEEAKNDPDVDEEELVMMVDNIEALKEEIEQAKNPTDAAKEKIALKNHYGFDLDDDFELKTNVYFKKLDRRVGLPVVRTGLGLTSVRKIDALKRAAIAFIDKRFEKYPDADVTVIEFDGAARVAKRKASKDQLLSVVNALEATGGNTDIYHAVNKAVTEIKANPSKVGINHIVLLTDGDSHSITSLPNLIDEMKSNNIVLDFICMTTPDSKIPDSFIEAATKVVQATGGEVTITNNADALNQKLFAVSSRLLIPSSF